MPHGWGVGGGGGGSFARKTEFANGTSSLAASLMSLGRGVGGVMHPLLCAGAPSRTLPACSKNCASSTSPETSCRDRCPTSLAPAACSPRLGGPAGSQGAERDVCTARAPARAGVHARDSLMLSLSGIVCAWGLCPCANLTRTHCHPSSWRFASALRQAARSDYALASGYVLPRSLTLRTVSAWGVSVRCCCLFSSSL